ncbi:MAG: hypothetical protein ACM3ZA_01030 [Bacillota bacterium]
MLLNVQNMSLTGLAPAFGNADAAGDTFPNNGRTFLHVKNAGAAPVDVTVNSQQACNQGFDHNAMASVPAGGERIIGPFPPGRFNNSQGQCEVTYSSVDNVTVAAISE